MTSRADPRPEYRFAAALSDVEASPIRELLKLSGDPRIISLAGGMPAAELFDVEGLALAAREALRTQPTAALQYGTTEGVSGLRQLLADSTSQHPRVRTAQTMITTGSSQGIFLAMQTLLDPGDTVAIAEPTFPATLMAARVRGARIEGIPTRHDGLALDVLEVVLRKHRPKLIYVIPTFSNPSGYVLDCAQRRQLLELAVRYRTPVLEDDPYRQLYFETPPPPTLLELAEEVPGAREWCIHLGSVSKSVAPGLRIGWMMGPNPILARAAVVKQAADAHTSTLAQHLVDLYLRSGRLEPHLDRVRAAYAERARTMVDELRDAFATEPISFATPTGGMFVWLDLGPDVDSMRLARAALDRGVAVVPGPPFYPNEGEPRVRLSFAGVRPEQIKEGVARLADAYHAVRQASA